MALGIAIVLTVAVGAWYLLLRGDGGTSEFLHAYERVVTAEATVEEAVTDVTRFAELATFDATLDTQMAVLQRQTSVFQRIADGDGGERGRLAGEAAAATEYVRAAMFEYRTAIIERKLTTASREHDEIVSGMADLDRIVTEWKNLE